MVRGKDPFWKHAKKLGKGHVYCTYCRRNFAGGISRIKSHLSGLKGRDIRICPRVPDAIKLEAQQAIKAIGTPTKRAKSVAVAASNTVQQGENISISSSSHMPNVCKRHDRSVLDKKLIKFCTSEEISFDAIQSPLFKDFLNSVAERGPGYQVTMSFTYQDFLRSDIKEDVQEYYEVTIASSVETGCTLMYNQSAGQKSFVDIFAYTPRGVVCIDTSSKISEEVLSFERAMSSVSEEVLSFERARSSVERAMSSVMKLIGPTNVVQLIINDGDEDYSNEVSSICREYPWIYRTPCATRGIELLLRKIYDVPFVYNTIHVARGIGTYIYKNKVNVSYLRKKVNGLFIREHKKVDAFASSFFMLTSLLEVENELQALYVPIETVSSLNDTHLNKFLRGTQFIVYVIHCKEFWSRAKMIAQVMRPIFQAHCLVRCEGPTSGYLYEMMESVKDALEQCRGSYHFLYDVIRNILDEVRSDIIHPIHAAAAFLNPMYMHSKKFKDYDEILEGVNYILEHLVMGEEKEDFAKQVHLYSVQDSNVFTPEAMIMLKASHPRIWWKFWGNHISVLQKYAIRILSQPCSSSLCNQYESLHKNLSQHAFMLNTMMMDRYESLRTQLEEPIILDKLEVSDDVNYQLLFMNGLNDDAADADLPDDSDGEQQTEYSFSRDFEFLVDWSHRYANYMLRDPTGSWLDEWPRK